MVIESNWVILGENSLCMLPPTHTHTHTMPLFEFVIRQHCQHKIFSLFNRSCSAFESEIERPREFVSVVNIMNSCYRT